MPTSRLVPGRYPAPGASQIADKIRERRGARGLTPLDGTLLHVPPVAEGWNSLLGAIRTKGELPGDVRELMILRVAARNHAAFEWIHHEHVGRSHGLTTAQLNIIRNTSTLPETPGVLNALQNSALAFADGSTKDVKVKPEVVATLQSALGSWAEETKSSSDKSIEDRVQDLLVEAAAITATYNMVSRFLVSLDVAGMSDEVVPWPADREEHKIPLPDHSNHHIYAVTYITDPAAPWLVFSNSLLTNSTMWEYLLPYLLAPQQSSPTSFNVLLHDQRGHGKSSTPPTPCSIPQLASDIAHIISYLRITIVHSVIGVSQGGAAVLSFAAQFPHLTKSIVSCDTGPRTPAGNKEAWQSRIELAKEKGMGELANVTTARWFPEGSKCYPGTVDAGLNLATAGARPGRIETVLGMVTDTSVDGFALGAGALMEYDLIDPSSIGRGEKGLLESQVKTLLVAGSLDGGGKVAQGMQGLLGKWKERTSAADVSFELIEGAGHLPMVDETEKFWEVLGRFLGSV